jgi:hypothetical protein
MYVWGRSDTFLLIFMKSSVHHFMSTKIPFFFIDKESLFEIWFSYVPQICSHHVPLFSGIFYVILLMCNFPRISLLWLWSPNITAAIGFQKLSSVTSVLAFLSKYLIHMYYLKLSKFSRAVSRVSWLKIIDDPHHSPDDGNRDGPWNVGDF